MNVMCQNNPNLNYNFLLSRMQCEISVRDVQSVAKRLRCLVNVKGSLVAQWGAPAIDATQYSYYVGIAISRFNV